MIPRKPPTWHVWGIEDTRNGLCDGCDTVTVVKRKPRGRRWLCESCYRGGKR